MEMAAAKLTHQDKGASKAQAGYALGQPSSQLSTQLTAQAVLQNYTPDRNLQHSSIAADKRSLT